MFGLFLSSAQAALISAAINLLDISTRITRTVLLTSPRKNSPSYECLPVDAVVRAKDDL